MANFSRNPVTVRDDALAKGYDRVLFQQGKPVLDRELNLLADLVSPQRLIEYHIGNGVPDGGDGFRISNLDMANNDFSVSAGRCLVGGHDIVLSTETTYKTQPHAENVAPLPAGTSYVYLRVFTNEVGSTEDSDLNNTGTSTNPDVGFETAVRRKVEWEVRVETVEQSGEDYFLLAVIDKGSATVTDRRRMGLTMASMRDEVTTARGSLTSLDARLDVSLNENGTLIDGATVTGDLIVNGKVGIGTTTPQNKLDVEGGAVIGATYAGANTAPTNGLLVEGRVGIGTASPEGLFHVSKPNTSKLQLIKIGNQNQPVREWSFDIDGSANLSLSNEGAGANFTALTVSNNGNVGLGTTTPQNKLDVEGGAVIGATYSGTNAAPANGLLVEGNVGIGNTSPRAGAKLEVSSGSLFISQANDYVQIDPWVGSNGCALAFYEDSQQKANLYWHKLSQTFLVNSAGVSNTVLNSNGGNVGIGTGAAAITAKLEVSGNVKISQSLSVGSGASATGADSVALGIQSQASGIRSIAIGDSAKATAQEAVAIGSDITVSGAGSLGIRLGLGGSGVVVSSAGVMAILEGNVGIGLVSPSAKLQILGGAIMPAAGNSPTAGIQFPFDPGGGSGDAAFIRYYVESGETTKLMIGCTNDADDRIGFYQFGAERLTLYNGNVGIGTATPGYKLDVNGGDLMVRNGILRSGTRSNFILALQGDRNLVLYDNDSPVWSSGTNVSDIELKKDILPIKNALEKIKALRGVCFFWKDESYGKGEQIGMVAQEVEGIIPQMVSTVKDTKLVHYQGLVPVLVEAIKEQQREIEMLKTKYG